MKPQPKTKKPSVSKLKSQLDTLFSRYVRLTHADTFGNCTCYTCGRVMPWKEIQCGHLFSRSRLATRFDPENCRPQCFGCNCMQKGNYQEYFPRIIEEIGLDRLNALEAKSKQAVKLNASWYAEQIRQYKEILGGMKDE